MGGVVSEGRKRCSFAVFNLMLSDIRYSFLDAYNKLRESFGDVYPMEYEDCQEWVSVYNDMVANQDDECSFYITTKRDHDRANTGVVYIVSRIAWSNYNPVSNVLFASKSYEKAVEFAATKHGAVVTTCGLA